MFKRRTPRSPYRQVADFIWPQSGWKRAAHYVAHRLRRLPDRPERIARGISVGVFTAFTPFYGFHFIVAALIARLTRANILAALMATFFGNPLTYVPIGIIALRTGDALLGSKSETAAGRNLFHSFAGAWRDLWNNLVALFTDQVAHWENLLLFSKTVFVPYLVGGMIPGLIAAAVCYYLSLPVIIAYQNRRKAKLDRKAAELRAARLIKQAKALPAGPDATGQNRV